MIQGNIVHNRYAGFEKRNRAITLVHFTDEYIALTDSGAGKRRTGVNEVFHIRTVHDRWASTSTMQNPPNHANRGGLAARACDTNTQSGIVEKLGKELSAGCDDGTDTTRGLHVGDRLLDSGGGNQDLTGPTNAAAILRMQQHATWRKIKPFCIATLVKRAVRTLYPSTPGLDDQCKRGHTATADAAEKVISKLGHRRNLQALPMRYNSIGALG